MPHPKGGWKVAVRGLNVPERKLYGGTREAAGRRAPYHARSKPRIIAQMVARVELTFSLPEPGCLSTALSHA
jgi:hypothetical protein